MARCALAASLAVLLAPACSLGQGTGSVAGTLNVPDCWSGCFDLHPDFFAAVPSNGGTMQIRVQNGSDNETFSDGLTILVDDAGRVRGDPLADGTPRASLLGTTLAVALPPHVTPPGVPVKAIANPPLVHATLYLERTCRTQNVSLYALDAVTLEADGTCNRPGSGQALVCGAAPAATDGGSQATAEAGGPIEAGATGGGIDGGVAAGPVAQSTIVFNSLFDGNPTESDDKQRLTDARFDLYLADPREIASGGLGPPPRCRGHIAGSIRFLFERGRPAQPFP
ncbi:MAG: hypothetical protein M3O36_02690 [Myxococcota bacterium]|nr:hypothetical protein [Myxococcota bacterium]